MNRREAIRRAWDDWHGDMHPDDIPSQVNPLFTIAFDAGFDAAVAEMRVVLTLLDGLADQWGDEAVFRRCRDRLRGVVNA
jgi:hypothetical protein